MRPELFAAAALAMGCGKKLDVQNHYYSLVLEAADQGLPPQPTDPRARVDLVAVHLPDFLQSRSLVLQVNSNEVIHARHHHWGEPLDLAILKVLARDLSTAMPAYEVVPGPSQADVLEQAIIHASNGAGCSWWRFLYTQGGTVASDSTCRRCSRPMDTGAVSGIRSALAA